MQPPSMEEDAPSVKLMYVYVRLQGFKPTERKRRVGLHACFKIKTMSQRDTRAREPQCT